MEIIFTTKKAKVDFFDNENKKCSSGYVLINPSEINQSVSVYEKLGSKFTGMTEAEKANTVLYKTVSTPVKDVSMTLYFDLVDLYEDSIQSLDAGKTTSTLISSTIERKISTGKSDIESIAKGMLSADINLFNEDLSCYGLLQKYSQNKHILRFSWGENNVYTGYLYSFSSRYTYFSPEGAPLRAEVQISLRVTNTKVAGDTGFSPATSNDSKKIETGSNITKGKDVEDIAKKCDSFSNPTYSIKIGKSSSNLEEISEDIKINDISVTMTSGYEANLCKISVSVTNTSYDDKTGLKVDEKSTKLFALGNKIEVYLGYKKEVKTVFTGFITSIDIEYSGENGYFYNIESLDAKFLMMKNKRKRFIPETENSDKKYNLDDTITKLIEPYLSDIGNNNVNIDAKDKTQASQYCQQESDYDFIVKEAKKENYLFFVSKDGKVNFIPYNKIKESSVTISPGLYLHKINKEMTLNGQFKSVKVVNSNNDKDGEIIESTVSKYDTIGDGSKDASDLTKLISNDDVKVIVDTTVKTVDDAKKRAEAALQEASLNLVSGTIDLVGLPEVEAGKFITVKGINNELNGNYFVYEVEHSFKDNHYLTVCKFKGNKVG